MADVRQILTTKAFKDSVVLGGNGGLSNSVKTITVAEVPDAADWLNGGEIVCTTGFFIRDSSVSQVAWIESLIQRNAAALAIKTTRFLGEISDAVRVLADSKKFPIIGLPADSTWPFVIESVMNLINDEQLSLLQHVEEIHRRLTELVLNGSSVPDIGYALANLVNNPVVVEDGRFSLISASLPTQNDNSTELMVFMENALNERSDGKHQSNLLHSDYYRRVMTGRSKEVLTQKLPKSKRQAITIPIMASNVVYGFITLIEIVEKRTFVDMAALEHGATAISLKMIRHMVQVDGQQVAQREAVHDLIHGRLHTSVLRNIGFTSVDWSNPLVAILIECRFERAEREIYIAERPEHLFEKVVRKHVHSTFGQCVLCYDGDLFTLLLPFEVANKGNIPETLRKMLQACINELTSTLRLQQLSVAVGGIYSSRNMLQQSYEDAQKSLEIITTMPSLGPIAFHEQIGIFRLIHTIKDDSQLHSYCNDYLRELMKHDEQNTDSLCDSLHTYLKLGGNVTATAKQLFVHPNTVSYRIRKIHGILGNQLEDPEYRTSLLMALNIASYLRGKEKAYDKYAQFPTT